MECDSDFLKKLRKLCLEFDVKCESWPEHELEGFALYEYARNPVDNPAERWNLTENSKDETGYIEEFFDLLEIKESEEGD